VTVEDAVVATRAITVRVGLHDLRRGPVDAHLRLFTELNRGLTLWPLIDDDRREPALVLKNLYALWFMAIDDCIDRDGSVRELDDSTVILLEPTDSPGTVCGALLREVMRLALRMNDDVTPLTVALSEVLTSLRYEHACRAHPYLAEAERFLTHSSTTFGLRTCLAIDVLAAGDTLAETQVRTLGRVYDELSIALRCASELASIERDREDGTLNLIEIWRINGVSGGEDELRRRAEDLVRRHVARAQRLAAGVDVLGLADVVASAVRLASTLSEIDVFAPSTIRGGVM
jgi:terpene synthase-like protein